MASNHLFRQRSKSFLSAENQEEPLTVAESPKCADVGGAMAPLGWPPWSQEQHAVGREARVLQAGPVEVNQRGGEPRGRVVLGRPHSPARVPEEGLNRGAVLHVGLATEAVAYGVLTKCGGERLAAGGRHFHRRAAPAYLLGSAVPGDGCRLLGTGGQSNLKDT